MSKIKQIWVWLGTPVAFRAISGLVAVYLFIAAFGDSRSYGVALNSLVLFCAIWWLGYNSHPNKDQP